MPPGPMGQEFWPEYNFGIFAWKLVDSIFRSPWNKWKNLLWRKKKKTVKFCSKMPLGPTSQESQPKYNFGVFARKLVDRIFRGQRNKWKNLF